MLDFLIFHYVTHQVNSIDTNKITYEGASAIGKLLEVNNTLTKLDLGDNKIYDVGVSQISHGLEHNLSLTQLVLSKSNIITN